MIDAVFRMRIVSYNVNGLKPRVAQSRSLSSFLDVLNADIICVQETKVSRQELTADIAIAEGYESFFSCNRIVKKGRSGYSGVATFCRVGQTTSSTSPVLPLAADEGFTGLLHFSRLEEAEDGKGRVGCYEEVFRTELSCQELLRLDGEGRCLVTDHGSFVLFNIYAPRVEAGDKERQEFKGHFFRTLQRRWEGLLRKGRRVIALGDFNVSVYPIDHCDPGPDFDKHESRKWLRSMLHSEGGPFRDVFRFIHPDRKEAYTCWSQASGAEEFNYGTRIDLIIAAGPCIHKAYGSQGIIDESHGFVECEVRDADILSEFRRVKGDTLPRWHGGRTLKLEGSDHAPVYVQLKEQPQVVLHEAPPLAARFMPELRGRQQSLVSLLSKQPFTNDMSTSENMSTVSSEGTAVLQSPPSLFSKSSKLTEGCRSPSAQKRHVSSNSKEESKTKRMKGKIGNSVSTNKPDNASTQKQKQSNLRTFFISSATSAKASLTLGLSQTSGKNVESVSYPEKVCEEEMLADDVVAEIARLPPTSCEKQTDGAENKEDNFTDIPGGDTSQEKSILGAVVSIGTLDGLECMEAAQVDTGRSSQTELYTMSDSQEKPNAALEWKRIQSAMVRAVPLCRGHKEPCVARVVKKTGPNKGRGFYVCARAEGPSSNPEARCDHFEWSSSSMKAKGKVLGHQTAKHPQHAPLREWRRKSWLCADAE